MIHKCIPKPNGECVGDQLIDDRLFNYDGLDVVDLLSKTSNYKVRSKHNKQCAHILQKRYQNHLQNYLGQNNFIKVHTPHLKDYQVKGVVNVLKWK
jgi:aspartyl/asparaginyl-tRNA synthetase